MPARWKIMRIARSLSPLSEARSASMNAGVIRLGLHSCTWLRQFRGGAVRLASPLPEIEITNRPLGRALFWGSLTAFVIALLIAAATSQYVGWRLGRIVSFAERVAGGDLTARIASLSTDEIGQVAAALDKTARRVEESFDRVQTSQRELETLLNSMQDAVIEIGRASCRERV